MLICVVWAPNAVAVACEWCVQVSSIYKMLEVCILYREIYIESVVE